MQFIDGADRRCYGKSFPVCSMVPFVPGAFFIAGVSRAL
jgi:hypothetical protein